MSLTTRSVGHSFIIGHKESLIPLFFFLAKSIMHAFGFRFSKNRKHQGYITSWWCMPIFLKKNACTNCISTTATSRKNFLKLAQIFTPCLMMILCPRGANLFVNIQLSLSNKYLNLWTKFVLFSYFVLVYNCMHDFCIHVFGTYSSFVVLTRMVTLVTVTSLTW